MFVSVNHFYSSLIFVGKARGPPGANVIKSFYNVSYIFCNKLECSSLTSLSRIVQYYQVRQEPTQVKNLLEAPLNNRLLALPTNNRVGWKGLPGANTLAYYKNS